MALIGGGQGGKLLAVANSNTYASNGGHNGSNGGAMQFDFYLPIDYEDTRTAGTNTMDVEYGFDTNYSCHYIATASAGSYYWGNTWKEFLIHRQIISGGGSAGNHMQIHEISDTTYRGHSSWNGGGSGDGSHPTLAVQSATNGQIRVTMGGDYFNSNNIEIYYLGGSAESAWIGNTPQAHPIYDTSIEGAWIE